MDKASLSIDRHTPAIPESCYLGMTPATERLQTLVKNKFILPAAGIPIGHKKSTKKVTITDHDLDLAERAMTKCAGDLSKKSLDYLDNRDITFKDIENYKICDLDKLRLCLPEATLTALSLHVPPQFVEHGSHGISIPVFNRRFMGFCTRIIDNPLCKYTVSIPNRYCFGMDYSQSEICVVEGVFDGIAMRKRGINCLAMADSQPNYYKMWVANQFARVTILLDNDYAGWLGTYKAYIILTEMLDRCPSTIDILQCSGGDPAESGPFSTRKVTIAELLSNLNLGIPHGPERDREDCESDHQ